MNRATNRGVLLVVSGAGRYNDILDTFTRHIAEIGYDGVNFGLVANELGVSKGTIVHHFGSKDRILAALHESYMTRRLAELDYILAELDDPVEQVAAALHAFLLYHEVDRAATVAFQREVVRLAGQESMAKGADLRQTYFTRFRDVIQSGIDSGQFREVDPTVDALLLFGSAQWAWTWFHPDGERPIEAICSAFVDLALGSLLINRRRLPQLSDAQGKAARTVRAAIAAVAEDAASTVA
ncbi:TetR/AcrR family transcriptional regulator [Nocardioides sp. CPCC 206347]|uniref:TetR/AcrR family transcriptional regulator n=1 Tax=Nocardioides sp. CPCC 206347 TaxID=3406463 RepID=UPI003B433410